MIGNPTLYSTRPPPELVVPVQPRHQFVGGAGTVGADQHRCALPGRDLSYRLTEDLDVVGGGVRAGFARTQGSGEELAGVDAPMDVKRREVALSTQSVPAIR